MFKFLKKSLPPDRGPRGREATADVYPGKALPYVRPDHVDELRYPPVDPGLPAASIGAVVRSQHDLIERLRLAVVSRSEPFDTHYLRPIEAVARYVHLLPATGFEHFAGPGGLFRFCVEMAFYCRQAADGRIFVPTGPVETRHSLEPRWRYAAFLSGLLCEICRPLSAAIVTDRSGRPWPKFMESLEAWLDAHHIDRYFISWQAASSTASSGAEGAAILGEIVPREQLAWLNAGSPAIVRDVFSTALGQARAGESVLSDMVKSIRERVLQAESLTRRSRYGRLRLGHHLEPHLLDALRSRLASGEWLLHNGIEGPLWYGTDGLYLAWPASAELLRLHVEGLGVPGVPRSAFTLAELLGHAGLLVPDHGGQWLWKLLVSDADLGEAPVYKTALRFKHPESLLGYLPATCQPRPYVVQSVLDGLVKRPLNPPEAICVSANSVELPPPIVPTTPLPPPRAEGPALVGTDAATPCVANSASHAMVPESCGAPAVRKTSSPDADLRAFHSELFSKWLALHDARADDLLVALPDGRIGVSETWLAQHQLDLASVVADMERHGWLGRGDWQGRTARIGLLPFADGPKLGFVINASAAKAWGFL